MFFLFLFFKVSISTEVKFLLGLIGGIYLSSIKQIKTLKSKKVTNWNFPLTCTDSEESQWGRRHSLSLTFKCHLVSTVESSPHGGSVSDSKLGSLGIEFSGAMHYLLLGVFLLFEEQHRKCSLNDRNL